MGQAAPARDGMLAAVCGMLLTVIPWEVLPAWSSPRSGVVKRRRFAANGSQTETGAYSCVSCRETRLGWPPQLTGQLHSVT